MRAKNQNGFSVVEVVIAAGILGIVGLGIATLMTNSMQSQRQISMRVDKTSIESDIKYLFKEAQRSCTCAFQHDLKPLSGGGSLASLISGSRNEISLRTSDLNLSYYGNAGNCSAAQKSPVITAGKVVGANDLQVSSMKLSAPVNAGGGKYFVSLTVSIQSSRNTDTSMRPVVVASIPVRIVSGNVECDQASEVLANVACPSGRILRGFSSEGEPICESNIQGAKELLASIQCPSGQMLTGFNSSASPVCASIPTPPPAVQPPPEATPPALPLVQYAPLVCQGGSYPWISSTYVSYGRCADPSGLAYWIGQYERQLDLGYSPAVAKGAILNAMKIGLSSETQTGRDTLCPDRDRYKFVDRDICKVRCSASPSTAGCVN